MVRMTSAQDTMYVHGMATRVYQVQDIAYANDQATYKRTPLCYQLWKLFLKYHPTRLPMVNACTVPYNRTFALKHLGFLFDHEQGDLSAFNYNLNYLQMASQHLVHCHTSRETKLLVYCMQIIPKALYIFICQPRFAGPSSSVVSLIGMQPQFWNTLVVIHRQVPTTWSSFAPQSAI